MHPLLVVTLLAALDAVSPQRAFTELTAMCDADRDRLWGRTLCGPTMLVDPKTREAIRNDGTTARLPDSIGIANTSVSWDGQRWTMLTLPLPSDVVQRRVLLAHESFHRIQSDLGLAMNNPTNAHLEDPRARALMRLEWRALARALAGDQEAIAEAVAYRDRRRTDRVFAEEERLLEMNEGLAEHTGYAMAIPNVQERAAHLVRKLEAAEKSESYSRSFAYASGPAWGALIEMKSPRWTRRLRSTDDLGEVARRVWNIRAIRINERDAYNAAAVFAEEDARATKKQKVLADLKARFLDGPTLTIPLQQMQFTFDPDSVQPFASHGTIYRNLELRDSWGVVKAVEGGLISPDYKKLVVPIGAYELTLANGWRVVDGARSGDKTLTKDEG